MTLRPWNQGLDGMWYQVYYSNQMVCGKNGYLEGGQSQTITVSVCNTNGQFDLHYWGGGADCTVFGSGGGCNTYSINSGMGYCQESLLFGMTKGVTTPLNGAQATNSGPQYVNNTTNQPIDFSTVTSTNLARDDTMKVGFDALFKALGDQTRQASADSRSLSNGLGAGLQKLDDDLNARSGEIRIAVSNVQQEVKGQGDKAYVPLTNMWDLAFKDYFFGFTNRDIWKGGTNVSAGMSNVLVGASNMLHSDLTNIAGLLSNNTQTAFAWDSRMTNQASAQSAGESMTGDNRSAADTLVWGLKPGSIPTAAVHSDGANWTMAFCGQTINFDPDVVVPGATSLCYNLTSVVVLILFALECGRLFWQASQTFAQAETGGVANLDLPFVGNVAGMGVVIIVAVAMVGLWMAAIALILPGMTGMFNGVAGLIGGVNIGANAGDLMVRAIPLNLILNCAITRVVLHFTAGKVVLIAGAASRFLIGK